MNIDLPTGYQYIEIAEYARLRRIEKAAEKLADYLKAIVEWEDTCDWTAEEAALAEYEKAVKK